MRIIAIIAVVYQLSFIFEMYMFRRTLSGMLDRKPVFNLHYVAYLKDDPAKQPIAVSYSAPGVLAQAARETGRAKADFEIRQISKEEYERMKSLLQI